MNTRAVLSDIIYRIVRYALYYQYDEQREFKNGLKLLAVCQEWRRAAMPIVYRFAYISSGRYGRLSTDRYDTIDELTKMCSTVKVDTNIDLIQSQNCVEFVRKLNVYVRYKALPLLGHAKIANVLSTASAIWPNVHTLNMSMYTCTYLGMRNSVESHTSVISEIASIFTQLLPRVRHLIFHGSTDNSMAQVFYGNIAGAYNNQLEKLSSKHPIVVPSDLIFTNLKHVDISLNKMENIQLTFINLRILESLKIIDAIDAKYWDSFCDSEKSNIIEFSNLKKLHVGQYQLDMSEDNTYSAYKLHFPCLQELIIDSCTTELPWLYTAVLPANINNLAINATHELFTIPESFAFPAVENLTLRINSDIRANRDELLESADRILAYTNKSSNVYLSIENDYFSISPQNINCNNITKLFIGGSMTSDNFYAYLTKMNQLVEIKCEMLIVSWHTEDTVFPNTDQLLDTNEMPLNICTETVAIKFSNPGDRIKKKVNVIKCLLLKLPSLTKLTATDVPEDSIVSFIDTYKQNYPQLSAVHLALKTTNSEEYEDSSDVDTYYDTSDYETY